MEIRTKFKVGDNIWTIKQVNKYIKCPKCKGNSKELIGNIEYHCANCYGTGEKLTQELEWIVQKENPCKITRIRVLQDENRIYIDYLGGTDVFNADYLGAEQDCFATKEEAQKECNRRNINCDECGDIDCEDCAKFKKEEPLPNHWVPQEKE